jgi:tetratricopeptide (TPR) repeat protein
MNEAATAIGRIHGYEVSDILLDYARADPSIGDVPDEVWPAVIDAATDPAAWLEISATAYAARRMAHAEVAARKAAQAGWAWGMCLVGALLHEQGDALGAQQAWQEAIDSGHPDAAPIAAVSLGLLLHDQGDAPGARQAYQQAINSGHTDWAPMAAVSLGLLLHEQGDAPGARQAYQQAIDSGHSEATPRAAFLLGRLRPREWCTTGR